MRTQYASSNYLTTLVTASREKMRKMRESENLVTGDQPDENEANLTTSHSQRSGPVYVLKRLIAKQRAHPRFRRRILIGAGALLLVTTSVVLGVIDGQKIEVPDLSKMTVEEGELALGEIDLISKLDSDGPPSWLGDFTTITMQTPAAGTRVFAGSVVSFDFAFEKVRVPSVKGMSFGQAAKLFESRGLKLIATQGRLEFGVGESLGEFPTVSASDLAGLSAAVDELGSVKNVDLTGEPFEILPSDEVDRWTIASLSENADAGIFAGSTLNATLSAPISKVPLVTGLTVSEAILGLEAAGLNAASIPTPSHSGSLPNDFRLDVAYLMANYWGFDEGDLLAERIGDPSSWRVTRQSVGKEHFVESGSNIVLEAAWPTTRVPRLIGKTSEEAIAALSKAGLSTSDTSLEDSGLVRSQRPKAGTVLPLGARVKANIRHRLTFSVTSSSATGLVTWAAPGSFSIEQANGARLPWKKSWYPQSEPGAYEYGNFNAQMNSGGGWIKCTITLDGRVVSKSRSTGPYAVVSCG